MILQLAHHSASKYASPVASSISTLQRISISKEISRQCSGLSQEYNSREVAVIARKSIDAFLTDFNRKIISMFSSDGGVPYCLLKRAIDVENLPPTPSDDSSPSEPGWRTPGATMLGYLKMFGGEAASFRDEMEGRLFHMVMPAKNNEISYLRSTKALNFHTEVVNGYFSEESPAIGQPIAPDIFALTCLRNKNLIKTTLLPLIEILDRLDNETINILQQPEFKARSQSSFDRNIEIANIPVLIPLHSGLLGIRYSHSKLAGSTERSVQALSRLKEVINSFDATHAVALEPGDLLVLNNRLCLHGRGEVAGTSSFDGEDRWLLRLYGYSPSTLACVELEHDSSHVMNVRQQPTRSPNLFSI